jgi:plastocyanin domain-containing protein
VLTTLAVGYVSLLPKAQTQAIAGTSGVQEVVLMVKGGYSPDVVVVQHGYAVRCKFTRQENEPCSERVLFPDFNKNVWLPEYKEVILEFTPKEPGEYSFHCHRRVIRGTLIVE